MSPLLYLIRKELLLLRRDWHALLLLFVMPTLFILIMSLALRDTFASHGQVSLTYYLVNQDEGGSSADIASAIRGNANFRELPSDAGIEELSERVKAGKAHFIASIPPGFAKAMDGKAPLQVLVQAGPGVEPTVFKLFEAAVREAVSRAYLAKRLQAYEGLMDEGADFKAADALVISRSLYEDGLKALPSSVQQNVPAWLVFAMFFIAIPLSTTWVQERSLGTLGRLRSMGISAPVLLIGKLVPYLLVNLAQVALMLLVGKYAVPLLGGESLGLGHSPAALIAMALSLSFASVSFALLISNLVSSSEQATIFTGVCNLVLAAIGGIMVPRFVMPLMMQKISLFSPLAWGLEGFLDIFLRDGGLAEVAHWAGLLLAFGFVSLALATLRLGTRNAK